MKNTAIDFQSLFESSPGLYLILLPDRNFTIVAVSDSYLKATMTERENIIGHGLFEIFPDNPDDPTADGVSNLRVSLVIVLKNKKTHTMSIQKYDIRKPDGTFEVRYWSPLNKPVLNSENEVAYIIHRVEDVTEFVQLQLDQKEKDKIAKALRAKVGKMEVEIFNHALEIQKINIELEEKIKERTAELAKSEKHFRTLIEYSFEAITLNDANGFPIYQSPSATRLLGWTKEDREKMSGFSIVHPEDDEKLKNIFAEVLAHPRKPFYNKHRLKNKDGNYIWVEAVIANFLDDPDIGAVICNFHDISGNVKAEKEILGLNESLEKRVQIRTEQLVALNKELEAFSYSVSHDLRAPLRAIDGYARMLEEDYREILDTEGKRLLGVVQQNAKKMGNLIDDLLAFSRLGKKELKKTMVDVTEIAESALTELKKSMPYSTKVHIQKLHPALADYSLLHQVFANLISNGMKYSSKKENAHVEIFSENTNDEIIYRIKDNGAGFNMQYAHKLFGVFQRLHAADEFDGTGVGLAIVQRIVNKHGGKIWASAEPGTGAEFSFTLPNE